MKKLKTDILLCTRDFNFANSKAWLVYKGNRMRKKVFSGRDYYPVVLTFRLQNHGGVENRKNRCRRKEIRVCYVQREKHQLREKGED